MTHNHTRHNALRRALPLLLGALFAGPALADKADPVGEVSTAFKLFGPNHKILVEAFDDPRIDGVACYLARPKTGGVKGGLGLAEDPSHASLSCHQIGPITLPEKLKAGKRCSTSAPRWCSRSRRWCAFTTRSAMRWFT